MARHMPAMGLVFCCNPNEVAEVFENFPKDLEQPTATTTPPITTQRMPARFKQAESVEEKH